MRTRTVSPPNGRDSRSTILVIRTARVNSRVPNLWCFRQSFGPAGPWPARSLPVRTSVGHGSPETAGVALLHLHEPFVTGSVEFGGESFLEDRHQVIPQVGASGHPLEVVPATMVIGPVELAARERPLHPVEESLVPDVHAEGDLRLASVSAKMALADQKPDEQAFLEVRRHRAPPPGGNRGVFHRHVTRETPGRG